MKRVLIVSTPAILEARNLAAWITRERIPGVRIAPSKGEWGVFAPAAYTERARRAFRRVVAANNPGGFRVVFKIRPQDPYTVMKKRHKFGRSMQIADMLVKGIVVKAAVLDSKGKVRFVAFKKGGRVASNPGMDALADAAVMMAARGARQYLDTHKLTADPAALTACLKSWVKAKFPEALKDAKDAISAGMHAVAEQTFAATMRLAGIEAAKEAARPPGASSNPSAPWGPLMMSSLHRTIIQDKRLLAKRGIKSRVSREKGEWVLWVRDRDRDRAQSITLEHVPAATERQLRRRFYRKSRHPEKMMRFQRREARKQDLGILRNARSYKRNASIESHWPRMTDRQREAALRIVGISDDVAQLWSYKDWSGLSSVVRQLLIRSWRHGGDTTKIRRVPVVTK